MPILEQIPIDQLTLDKTNPRIQRALEMYGDEITAERIALALKEGSDDAASANSSFNRLKNSIIKNQGIITPIIVNRINGNNVCIEGNTRLWIYKELNNGESTSNWSNIQCLVYENAGPEKVDAIRLQAHLIGPRPWDPYSKARYLHYLWNEEYLGYDEIIEYCGGNRKSVEDSIAAYNLVENVYRPMLEYDTDFDHTRFSGFVEYQNDDVNRAVYAAGFDEKDFSNWLHHRQITRLEHVRDLPRILKDDEARNVFLTKNSTEALKILNRPSIDELVNKLELEDLLYAIQLKIGSITYEETVTLKEKSGHLHGRLLETRDLIDEFTRSTFEHNG